MDLEMQIFVSDLNKQFQGGLEGWEKRFYRRQGREPLRDRCGGEGEES